MEPPSSQSMIIQISYPQTCVHLFLLHLPLRSNNNHICNFIKLHSYLYCPPSPPLATFLPSPPWSSSLIWQSPLLPVLSHPQFSLLYHPNLIPIPPVFLFPISIRWYSPLFLRTSNAFFYTLLTAIASKAVYSLLGPVCILVYQIEKGGDVILLYKHFMVW